MFAHFVTNFPASHRILIFVCLQTPNVPKIPIDERFLVGRIGPKECRLFRCIVRYGYKDGGWDSYDFEDQLFMKIAEFLEQEEDELWVNREMAVIGKLSNQVVGAVSRSKELEESQRKVKFEEVLVKEKRSPR
uniref:K+ potassium transporter C-terminal domain-containing protein n=1 Tax=Ananas comosus var. bracteatus TaxID=296719 RepID=A0A6V7PUP0_ANACO|nr:unnamed protein product [Ananas comosus var. bracteatus]